MIRREAFGGLVFHEPTHKVYTLNRPAFRLVELACIQGQEMATIQRSLKNELNYESGIREMEQFLKDSQLKLGTALDLQVGTKENTIWEKKWSGQYFSAPINNFWTFTNLCNLHCTHCAWDSARPLPDELTLKQCLQLIDQMQSMGVCELSFSGGEPLTKKKQLLSMAAYATARKFHLGLATNATLINQTVADELGQAGFSEIQVSFEGLEAHENIRGRGVWSKTIEGVRLLVRNGFDITFAVAINKTNFGELDNIFATAIKEGVKNIRFVRFIPIGRGQRNMNLFEFSVEEEIRLAKILWQKRWELHDQLIITFNKHYVSIGVQDKPELGCIPETFGWNWDCPSGRSRLCIMPQGKVAPCPLIGSLGLNGGDIREQSLADIWGHSEFFHQIRTDKRQHNKQCASCSLWAKCSGGCKAASMAHFGKLMEIDPLCLQEIKGRG